MRSVYQDTPSLRPVLDGVYNKSYIKKEFSATDINEKNHLSTSQNLSQVGRLRTRLLRNCLRSNFPSGVLYRCCYGEGLRLNRRVLPGFLSGKERSSKNTKKVLKNCWRSNIILRIFEKKKVFKGKFISRQMSQMSQLKTTPEDLCLRRQCFEKCHTGDLC